MTSSMTMTDVEHIIKQAFAENDVNDASALQQAATLAQAGLANPDTLESFSRSSKSLSTIRFRAMLQDTGYAMELYMPSDVGSSSVTPMDMGNLRERWVGWAIEPPGVSSWYKTAGKKSASASPEDSETAAWLDNAPTAKFADPESKETHVGALIKIYDPSFQSRPASVFDFIGILSSSPMPSNSPSDDEEAKLVPTIHVLHYEEIQSAAQPDSPKRAKEGLLDLLARCFAPRDEVAAELLLCALLSYPTARTAQTNPIGTLSLNLIRPAVQSSLEHVLRLVMPYVVNLDLSLPVLHQSNFVPTSSTSDDLNAGRLQIAAGSVLLVDEDGMGEGGQLQEKAVKNLQYLSDVMSQQKLPYEYPFATGIKMSCAIRPLILSQGKSLLPVDMHIPSNLAEERPEVDEEVLEGYRAYLAAHGSPEHAAKINIPEDVAEQIQTTYIDERKTGADKAAKAEEALKNRLRIARLLAASEEKPTVTLALWQRAVELDEEVTKRMQQRDAERRERKLGIPSTNSAT